ncbi:hypothetical protein EG329_013843 [Mollisiaceae sp. DMI_Dod_QoI]|nr:hypothetical protein EG329_013843 [Helotiales sp. DMI_Dod_QoI]
MHGLLGAFLLAPALASAVVVPNIQDEDWKGEVSSRPVFDRVSAPVIVTIPSDLKSPDHEGRTRILGLELEVLNSEEACGYGNVTIDGQALPQSLDGDVSSGKGPVSTRESIIFGSWSFYCIKVNGVPDSQLLKFAVDSVDGETVQDVGFSVLFRQFSSIEVITIETNLSVPDKVVANPNPEGLQLAEDLETPHYSVEEDIAELDYLRSQLREIKYLIRQKETALARHGHYHQAVQLKDCDSLKCIVNAIADHARYAAHELYGKVRGKLDEEEDDLDQFGKPHFKHPKFPHFKGPKGRKNHTCGPPKHIKFNHSLPIPPFKKPHRPLPICRYPPPFHHHGPSPFFHYRPYGKPPGGPEQGFRHGPEDRPLPLPHHHMEGPPDFDAPPHHDERPIDFDSPPPHHNNGQHDYPTPPPPQFAHEQGHMGPPPGSDGEFHPHGPPSFDGPRGPSGPHRNGLGKAFQIIKFLSIGFIFAFLILALHRRACTPERRADRRAHREERRRRRAYRRAAHKHIITRLLARLSGNHIEDPNEDYEEKRQALLANAEDGMSTTMSEDLSEIRNVAEVVGEMVDANTQSSSPVPAASEPMTIPVSETRPLMRDFELGSQVGDGEELPAYEDNDRSEMSSVVADGFRYTPGSSEYSPGDNPAGSASDILGPDTKS